MPVGRSCTTAPISVSGEANFSELAKLATMAWTSPETSGRFDFAQAQQGVAEPDHGFAVRLGQGAHGDRADVAANERHAHGCAWLHRLGQRGGRPFSAGCRPRAPEPVQRGASFRPTRAWPRRRCLKPPTAVTRAAGGAHRQGALARPRAGPPARASGLGRLSTKNGSPGGRRGRCFPASMLSMGVTPARASLAKLQP